MKMVLVQVGSVAYAVPEGIAWEIDPRGVPSRRLQASGPLAWKPTGAEFVVLTGEVSHEYDSEDGMSSRLGATHTFGRAAREYAAGGRTALVWAGPEQRQPKLPNPLAYAHGRGTAHDRIYGQSWAVYGSEDLLPSFERPEHLETIGVLLGDLECPINRGKDPEDLFLDRAIREGWEI